MKPTIGARELAEVVREDLACLPDGAVNTIDTASDFEAFVLTDVQAAQYEVPDAATIDAAWAIYLSAKQ